MKHCPAELAQKNPSALTHGPPNEPQVLLAQWAAKAGGPYSNGRYEDVVSGKYPLSRFLYIYVNKAPGKALDPVVREFLKLVLSREGQEIVVKDGYYPLSEKIVQEELAKLR